MSERFVSAIEGAEIDDLMPLVHQVVGAMIPRLPPNILRDDLVAAGTFGLLDALRRHGTNKRGAEFAWYVRVRVRGAILDDLREQDWLSRRWRRHYTTESRIPGAAVVGIDDLPEERRTMVDDGTLTPENVASARSDAHALAKAVDRLPTRERSIITAHYFEGVQLRSIAHELGVSDARISQLHARAVARLREYLADAA